MTDVTEFVEHYSASNRNRIEFSWNGKHASEFVDANQIFRWEVAEQCIENPNLASLTLLEHLFLADADWAVQAWGAPRHFAPLGSALLERGGSAALDSFALGFNASFDTYGACHEIQLPSALLTLMTSSASEMLEHTLEVEQRVRMESTLELFNKLGNSTAAAGWMKVDLGAEVSDIQIVWPRWYHKVWKWLSRTMSRVSGESSMSVPTTTAHGMSSSFAKEENLLPFSLESTIDPVRLFELDDGRFQLLESGAVGPFLPGHGYLIVERRLANFLIEQDVGRIVCEDAILFDRPSGREYRTHVRVRIGQYFTPDQINDLDLNGPRLLTMNDGYYFVSPELRERLKHAQFDYLVFREGLSGFAGVQN